MCAVCTCRPIAYPGGGANKIATHRMQRWGRGDGGSCEARAEIRRVERQPAPHHPALRPGPRQSRKREGERARMKGKIAR